MFGILIQTRAEPVVATLPGPNDQDAPVVVSILITSGMPDGPVIFTCTI